MKRVIFFLNAAKVGTHECYGAANLVVVEIPDGVKSIGKLAFNGCSSLTAMAFPRTLTFIGDVAFWGCSSLENVDLLHTNF